MTKLADELLPCPFCNVRLNTYSEAGGYYHKNNGCQLSGEKFPADGYFETRCARVWQAMLAQYRKDAKL